MHAFIHATLYARVVFTDFNLSISVKQQKILLLLILDRGLDPVSCTKNHENLSKRFLGE